MSSQKRSQKKRSKRKRAKAKRRERYSSPHDRFARKLLQRLRIVLDLLRYYTDSPVLQQEIDLNSLQHAPTHSINHKLKEVIRDVSYYARFKNTELTSEILFTLEHKSRPNRFVALQLGAQAVLAPYLKWTEKRTSSKEFRPPIPIMIVLYHGKQKWAKKAIYYQNAFVDLKKLPKELRKLVPQFKIIVINLARFEYGNLPGSPETQAFVESLKRAMDGTFADHLEDIFRRVREAGLEEEDMWELLNTIAMYCSWSSDLSQEQLDEAITKAFDESEGIELYKIMPKGFIKDAFLQGWKGGEVEGERKGERKGERRGKRKGKKIGKKIGKAELLLEVLQDRLGEVPPEIVHALKKTRDAAIFRSLAQIAATCSSFDEFAEALPKRFPAPQFPNDEPGTM